VWGGVMQPRSVASWFHAISVAMEQWTVQHRSFVAEAYFKNGDSAITTQLFHRHFSIPCHGCGYRTLGKCFSIKKKTLRQNSYSMNTRKCGSVRRQSDAIGLSDHSMQRILHRNPYKSAIVQELSDRKRANHRISSKQLLEMLNDECIINTVLKTDEAHFHLSGFVNKQNYCYWAPENP
jgi:hypothetical protein